MVKNPNRIAIDLDGVLAEYSGWQGMEVVGKPRQGALEFLQWLDELQWEPIIYTIRDRDVVINWLEEHDLARFFHDENRKEGPYRIAGRKPIVTVYLDDRALRFEGSFALVKSKIISFKPYWERG